MGSDFVSAWKLVLKLHKLLAEDIIQIQRREHTPIVSANSLSKELAVGVIGHFRHLARFQ